MKEVVDAQLYISIDNVPIVVDKDGNTDVKNSTYSILEFISEKATSIENLKGTFTARPLRKKAKSSKVSPFFIYASDPAVRDTIRETMISSGLYLAAILTSQPIQPLRIYVHPIIKPIPISKE